jgi:phosphatidate cytidylyltransferase
VHYLGIWLLQISKMSSFLTRSITGIVLIITITAAVLTSHYTFIILLFVINLLALTEFYKLVTNLQFHPGSKEGLFLSTIFFASVAFVFAQYCDWRILLVNVISVGIIFIRELYKDSLTPFQNLALTFFGVAYITLPMIAFASISFLPFHEERYHPEMILGYFIILWASDSGAYAIGTLIGKHKLFERISPNKTWEGTVGGGVLSLAAAYFISSLAIEISLIDWLIISLIIVVTGTYGDLFKSLLKRSAHVKDSGNLLPGHGGFLDRFDSLIGSAPFVFGYLTICKNWVF